MLADTDRFMARRTDLDKVLAIALLQRDFQAPGRPEAVHALDDPVEPGAPGLGDNRDLVGPNEEACLAIGQSMRIAIEPATREVDTAVGDGDRNDQRLANEMMHERALGL